MDTPKTIDLKAELTREIEGYEVKFHPMPNSAAMRLGKHILTLNPDLEVDPKLDDAMRTIAPFIISIGDAKATEVDMREYLCALESVALQISMARELFAASRLNEGERKN